MKQTRVISLWQPYASFIAWGIKRYETRHWYPRSLPEGSTLLIHSAKRKPKDYEMRLFNGHCFKDVWQEHNIASLEDLDYGVILCATKFIKAHSTDILQVSACEKLVGNYQPSRYAWELELLKVANPPILARGQQGIWYYEW